MSNSLVLELQKAFLATADNATAQKQAAYMKNHFFFLGLQKPKRALLQNPIFKEYVVEDKEDLKATLLLLWELDHREFHYAALDLALKYRRLFVPSDLEFFKVLITRKSWWDTVDHLAINLVGFLASKHSETVVLLNDWVKGDCMWVHRTALLFQIHWKEKTQEDMLFDCCKALMHEKEFFIRKAIGWALRQYSKVRPEPVKRFIDVHRAYLSGLSIREGSKYL